MFRSIKYGLYGAVLAGVVVGTAAWHQTDKTVRLVVDGQASAVHTTSAQVSDVLRGAGYSVGPHDLVAPGPTASVHNGSEIVLRRGRLLYLTVNGLQTEVWTTAPTVAQAMAQLGYSTADFTSVSRDRRLPLSPTSLSIRTPSLVTVIVDGRKEQVTTTDPTVGALLGDLGIAVSSDDRVSPSASVSLANVSTVTVNRVQRRTLVASKVLPFATQTQKNAKLSPGTTQVVRAGRNGMAQVTYAVVYLDGKVVGKTPIKTTVVTPPVSQVVAVGAGTSASAASVPPAPAPSPGTAQAYAKSYMAKQYGWGTDQFNCLVQIWDHESGWRYNAANGSGAYGIPQALPGSKMATAGADWQTNPDTQIRWGLGYIQAHYGTPCGAWSSWQVHGWY